MAAYATRVAGAGEAGKASRGVRILRALKRDRYLYIMALFPLAYFIIFHYVPLYGLTLAFKDFNISKGIWGSPWVGLKYFEEFFGNPYSWVIIRNTIVLRVWHLVIGFPAPIILALLLNELRGQNFKRIVQSSSYLPHFISLVVVAGMIVNFVAYDGPINRVITQLGGTARPWLQLPEWFAPIFTFSGIWQNAGWASIIYLAALTGINQDLIEASVIDGAGRWQRIRNIILPGIAPTITIMLLLRIGQLLTMDYQLILLLYSPAIYETADVLGTYIYRRGILGADFSYATAVGLFQSAVGFFFIVVSNWISKRYSETSLW